MKEIVALVFLTVQCVSAQDKVSLTPLKTPLSHFIKVGQLNGLEVSPRKTPHPTAAGLYNLTLADGIGNGNVLLTDGTKVYGFTSFRSVRVLAQMENKLQEENGGKSPGTVIFNALSMDLSVLQNLKPTRGNQKSAVKKVGKALVSEAVSKCTPDRLKSQVTEQWMHFPALDVILMCKLHKDELLVFEWQTKSSYTSTH